MFVGLKKCTRNSTDCLLCLRVLKKIPVRLCRDDYFRRPWVLKKIPAILCDDDYVQCLWVLKKTPARLCGETTFGVRGY